MGDTGRVSIWSRLAIPLVFFLLAFPLMLRFGSKLAPTTRSGLREGGLNPDLHWLPILIGVLLVFISLGLAAGDMSWGAAGAALAWMLGAVCLFAVWVRG